MGRWGLVFAAIVFSMALHAEDRPTKYEKILERLTAIQQLNVEKSEIFELGLNDKDVMIKGIKIGDGKIKNLLVATHHGNEYGSTELAMAFAESVAKNPIKDQTIWVIPVLNISGYNAGNRYESTSHGSFDPNRDYPGPCGSEGPHNLKSTRLLADLFDREKFVISSTVHTFWPGVFYPWGIPTSQVDTPYTNEFIQLGKWATQESNYTVGNSTEIIYPVEGAFEDWAFWAHGAWSLLFEVAGSHSPNPQQVTEMIRTNVPGLRRMYENGPTETAKNHQFNGSCNSSLRLLDLHNE